MRASLNRTDTFSSSRGVQMLKRFLLLMKFNQHRRGRRPSCRAAPVTDQQQLFGPPNFVWLWYRPMRY